ncbi:hypothetical protein D3C76_1509380 [compost metagenome]
MLLKALVLLLQCRKWIVITVLNGIQWWRPVVNAGKAAQEILLIGYEVLSRIKTGICRLCQQEIALLQAITFQGLNLVKFLVESCLFLLKVSQRSEILQAIILRRPKKIWNSVFDSLRNMRL